MTTEANSGWKLVPAEPTEAMLLAACDVDRPYDGDFGGTVQLETRVAIQAYKAMLAAAPSRESDLIAALREAKDALNEVATNGQWTHGEQIGEWQITKQVYEMVCDARDAADAAIEGRKP